MSDIETGAGAAVDGGAGAAVSAAISAASAASAGVELIDIYNEARQATGEVVPRGTFLQPGQFQLYTLAVIIDAHGRYLITQRSAAKSWGAGLWEIPGGGVPAGETSAQAIVREVAEEVGLDARGCEPELLMTYVNVDPTRGHNYFTDIWLLRLDFAPEDVVLQVEEADAFCLATWDDIAALGAEERFLHFSRLQQALGK